MRFIIIISLEILNYSQGVLRGLESISDYNWSKPFLFSCLFSVNGQVARDERITAFFKIFTVATLYF